MAKEHDTPIPRQSWAGSSVVAHDDSAVTLHHSHAGQQAAATEPMTKRVRCPTRSATEPTGPPSRAAKAGPGTTPKPAASTDHPQSSWSNKVLNKMVAMNAQVKNTWPRPADQNDRIRTRERSISGLGWRAERTNRITTSIRPTPTVARVRPEP